MEQDDTGRSELVWEGQEEALLRPEALIHKGLGRAGSWGRGVCRGEKDGREQQGVELCNSPHCPKSQLLVLDWVGLGMAAGDTEPGCWLSLVGSCGFFLAVLNQGWYPAGPRDRWMWSCLYREGPVENQHAEGGAGWD